MRGAKPIAAAALLVLVAVGLVWLLLHESRRHRPSAIATTSSASLEARLGEIEQRLAQLEARLDLTGSPVGAGARTARGLPRTSADPSSAAHASTSAGDTAASGVTLSAVAEDVEGLNADVTKLKQLGDKGAEALAELELEKQRQKVIAELRTRFRDQMAEDGERLGREEAKRLEDLYQQGSAAWGTNESLEAYRQVLARYPDSARAGCSAVFLGQQLLERGDIAEAERTLTQAVEQWDDRIFGNGVQVGAIARLHLAEICFRQGRVSEGQRMAREIIERYPDAVDHRGEFLRDVLAEHLK